MKYETNNFSKEAQRAHARCQRGQARVTPQVRPCKKIIDRPTHHKNNNRRHTMLYRENGQFKTSYRADQQIFPIAQDTLPSGSSSRWPSRWCQRLPATTSSAPS